MVSSITGLFVTWVMEIGYMVVAGFFSFAVPYHDQVGGALAEKCFC
jgi:hypothetical protein